MKIKCLSLFCATSLAVGFALPPNAQSLEIVKNGEPNASIIVTNDASQQVKNAAQTLQEYIEKSSGAKLPIKSTFDSADNVISIGKTSEIDISKLDEDGFILQGIGKKYFIAGGSDWGTEFGIYDFLERYLGVRWLMPTDIGINVPTHSTIDIPEEKITENPVFLSRQLSPLNIAENTAQNKWARFNRARGRVAFHHNLLNLFAPSKFAKTHPEFYPVINGKRMVPTENSDYRWQPNLSAPGIVDAAAEEIEKYFSEHPEATSYSLGMNDTNNWDESPASKARRNGKQNYLGYEDISDDYFEWANAVVEKVLLKYPDKWFGTLAYNGIAEPPTRVKVHPRIVPFITYDRMRWEDPKLRQTGQEMTERWAKESPVLGWYDYAYGISYQLPRVYFHRMQKYLSWGAENQVQFSYAELYPNWGEGPKPWVFEKLLWNPHQNADDLLNDWYTHFAGEKAAPHLAEFYSIWEKFWAEDIYKSAWNTDRGQYLPFNADPSYLADVPKSYITQSDAAFTAALELADTPERKARVAKLKEMWDFYKASIIVYQGENLTATTTPQTQTQALEILDEAENVLQQAQKRRELLTAFTEDPLYSLSADYITRYPGTNGENWGTSILWRVQPWIEKSSVVKTRIQKLGEDPNPAISGQAKLLLQVASGQSKLVSANASFENELENWTVWDKHNESGTYHKGIWQVTQEQAHSGKHSLLIQGLGRGAPIQNIPYQAGTYYAQVYCYIPAGTKVGTASLELALVGAKGDLAKVRLPASNIPLRPDSWNSIVIPFTLPESDSSANVSVRWLLLLNGFEPDGKIYVDDAGIYKVEN